MQSLFKFLIHNNQLASHSIHCVLYLTSAAFPAWLQQAEACTASGKLKKPKLIIDTEDNREE